VHQHARPFVGLSEQSMQLIGINQIYSIQISTNDPRGFAINTLYAEEDPPISTPEPAAPCLALFGLASCISARGISAGLTSVLSQKFVHKVVELCRGSGRRPQSR